MNFLQGEKFIAPRNGRAEKTCLEKVERVILMRLPAWQNILCRSAQSGYSVT